MSRAAKHPHDVERLSTLPDAQTSSREFHAVISCTNQPMDEACANLLWLSPQRPPVSLERLP
jgi:hypothetical protein